MDYFTFLKKNDLSTLAEYLKQHSVNENLNGCSLLYWAAFNNNLLFARYLIQRGANVNEKTKTGETVLSICCFYGYAELVKLLIQSGAEIDSRCFDRAYFGWDGHIQAEILGILKQAGYINLYVDDLRDCPPGFEVARTVEEAIEFIVSCNIHILSLDHDMGEDQKGNLRKTGYDLILEILNKGIRPADRVYIHSQNPSGTENIYKTLLGAKRRGFLDQDIQVCRYPYL